MESWVAALKSTEQKAASPQVKSDKEVPTLGAILLPKS